MTYYLALWIVLILIGLAHSTRFGTLLYTTVWTVSLMLRKWTRGASLPS